MISVFFCFFCIFLFFVFIVYNDFDCLFVPFESTVHRAYIFNVPSVPEE